MRMLLAMSAVFVAFAVSPLLSTPASASAGTPSARCRFADSRIDEASGIARGIVSPGVVYVQNDSGDLNRFFAVNATTCRTAAVVTVTGATNVDWEDIAVAPDPAGTPSVWVADTGDNNAVRHEVDVYRVAEPRISGSDSDRALRTESAAVWRLRYPSGPTDAESLAVTPQGAGYVITKSLVGNSTVYRLPARPDRSRVQELREVGAIRFRPTGTPGPFGIIGELSATSAAISRDGSLLAVRTYTDAYLWPVRAGDVAGAIAHPPIRVALPVQRQGEGIAIDGHQLLVDSEGRRSPVYAVAMPGLAAGASGTKSSAAAASGAAASSAATSATSATSGGSSSSGAARRSSPSPSPSSPPKEPAGGGWLTGGIVLAVAVVGATAWWILQLRRPSR